MSFAADVPAYPYIEPKREGDAKAPRSLKVFVLAEQKMRGVMADTAKPWPGEVEYARPVMDESLAAWWGMMKLGPPPRGWWLTEFVDRSSPRPGTADVVFGEDPKQTEVTRSRIFVVAQRSERSPPLGTMALAATGLAAFVLTRRLR